MKEPFTIEREQNHKNSIVHEVYWRLLQNLFRYAKFVYPTFFS